jgi:GLPGLI family protein
MFKYVVTLLFFVIGNPFSLPAQEYLIQYGRTAIREMPAKLPYDDPALVDAFKKQLERSNNTQMIYELRSFKNKSSYTYKNTRLISDPTKEANVQVDQSVVYKNVKASEFCFLFTGSKDTYVKDNFKNALEWVLLDEDKMIGRFKCKKANSKKYPNLFAWYCPEIPLMDGPGVHGGLPGLIIRLEQEYVITEVVDIKILKSEGTEIVYPDPDKSIDYAEYKKNVKQMMMSTVGDKKN